MTLFNSLSSISITTLIDLTAVGIILAGFAFVLKKIRSLYLIGVLFGYIVLYVISNHYKLHTLEWVLEKSVILLLVLFFVLFQPELRRVLEQFRHGRWVALSFGSKQLQTPTMIKQLITAIEALSKQKIGAIIAIENKTNLDLYLESGLEIDALISSDLILSLFWPGSPTHDGAVIIRANKVAAAGCLLPLTESTLPDRRLGTRHMAAIGLSEVSDAFVLIVSEETGTISIAENGHINRYLNREALETRFFNLYKEDDQKEDGA